MKTAPAAQDHARYRAAAAETGLPFPAVDLQALLKRADPPIAVDVVSQRRPLILQALCQHVPDGGAKRLDLLPAKLPCGAPRKKSRPKERLVGIDISQPRDELLVEEQRFNRPLAPFHEGCQPRGGKRRIQRLHPESQS